MTRVSFTIPGHVKSLTNRREHWRTRALRARRERDHARLLCRAFTGLSFGADVLAFGAVVTLTRCAPRKLDTDGAVSSVKSYRDGIADSIGCNDADPRITWCYGQEKCKAGDAHVRVEIEARPSSAEGART